MDTDIYQTLNKLKGKQQQTQKKPAAYIYLDESDGKIKERPLQSAGSAYITHKYKNPAKIIHEFMFGR